MIIIFLTTAIFDTWLQSLGCKHFILPLLLEATKKGKKKKMHMCTSIYPPGKNNISNKERFCTEKNKILTQLFICLIAFASKEL